MNRIHTYIVFCPCLNFWPAFQCFTKYISYIPNLIIVAITVNNSKQKNCCDFQRKLNDFSLISWFRCTCLSQFIFHLQLKSLWPQVYSKSQMNQFHSLVIITSWISRQWYNFLHLLHWHINLMSSPSFGPKNVGWYFIITHLSKSKSQCFEVIFGLSPVSLCYRKK